MNTKILSDLHIGDTNAAAGGYLCFRDNQSTQSQENTYTLNGLTMQQKASTNRVQFLFKGLAVMLLAFCASLTCAAQTTTTISEPISSSPGAPVIVPLDPNARKVAVKVPAIVNTQAAQTASPSAIKPAEQQNIPVKETPAATKAPAATGSKKLSVNQKSSSN